LEVGAKIFIVYCVLTSRVGGDELFYRKLSATKKTFNKQV
jgi:hypothetical protein